MATTVGTESRIDRLVENLLSLEHDAIAAYDATIERLDDEQARRQIAAFREDHAQHVGVLETMAKELGLEPRREGDAKEMLTTGKIKMANLVGDGAILKAMKTNEDDTVTAYARARDHEEAKPASVAFFTKALEDEKRHREYMETLSQAK